MQEITLGLGEDPVTIPVYEQSVPYLLNRFGRFVEHLQATNALDLDTSVDGILPVLGAQAYAALEVLIPNLPKRMPEHRFLGYPSEAARDAGEFDETAAREAPSMGQIKAAFKVALEVSGLDFTTLIRTWADPTILRPAINIRAAEWISGISPRSPSANGASTPSGSGTTSPSSSETVLAASPA